MGEHYTDHMPCSSHRRTVVGCDECLRRVEAERDRLREQRDALVEALFAAREWVSSNGNEVDNELARRDRARIDAALSRAQEPKA